MAGNREYKSDVFSMLLEEPGNALEVYNALNNSGYQDPEIVEICTLERGISLSVRNDASFFLGMDLNIYEHESTVCPNMPLREYMTFVDCVRGFRREYKDLELLQVIEMAIDRCIEENVLRDFLKRRRGEVAKVTQLDYTFERQLELEREEARAEERANTERERKAKEKERQAREKEKKRADLAEEENRRLRAELERYKKQK